MGKPLQKSRGVKKQLGEKGNQRFINKAIPLKVTIDYKSKLRGEITEERRNAAVLENCKKLTSKNLLLQKRSEDKKELCNVDSKKQDCLKNPKRLKRLCRNISKNEKLQNAAIDFKDSSVPKQQKQVTSLPETDYKTCNEYNFDQNKFLKVELNRLKLDTQTNGNLLQHANMSNYNNLENHSEVIKNVPLKDLRIVCEKLDFNNHLLNMEVKPAHQNLFDAYKKMNLENYLSSKNKSKVQDVLVEREKSIGDNCKSGIKTEPIDPWLLVVCEKLNVKNYTSSLPIETKNKTNVKQDTGMKTENNETTNGILHSKQNPYDSNSMLNRFNIRPSAMDENISKETISSEKKQCKSEICNFDLPTSSKVSHNSRNEFRATELLDFKRNTKEETIPVEDSDEMKYLQSLTWLDDYKSDKISTSEDINIKPNHEENSETASSNKRTWCVVS